MIKLLKLSDRRIYRLCERNETERHDQRNQHPNDEVPFQLNGIIWKIYLDMLRNNGSISDVKTLQKINKIELQYNLEKLENMGLVKKEEDKYEVIEDKKLDVILSYLLRKDKYSQMRLVFYLSLLIVSFLLFLIYNKYMPHNILTTTNLSFFFCIFSIIAITIELIINMKIISFYQKLFEK